MSLHQLAGAITKLRQADDHLILLYREVSAYIRGAPMHLEAKRDSDGHGRFYIHVTRQPPLKLAAIIGDVLHNLRSALDYIAHEMILRNGFPTSKRTQYPICATTKDFDNEAIGQGRLTGISLIGYRLIDAFQPHQMRSPYTYAHHPLWHLHKLSNFDKHHALNLSALGTTCHWRYLDRADGSLRYEEVLEQMMYDGAEVGSMSKSLIDDECKIRASITTMLTFRDEPVADRDVLAVLQSIREFIGEFILPSIAARLFDPLPADLVLQTHGLPASMRAAAAKPFLQTHIGVPEQ